MREEMPEEFRPPKMWPTALLAAITLITSVYAAQSSYRSERKVNAIGVETAATTAIRCDIQEQRLQIAPETRMEEFLRKVALETYTRDC